MPIIIIPTPICAIKALLCIKKFLNLYLFIIIKYIDNNDEPIIIRLRNIPINSPRIKKSKNKLIVTSNYTHKDKNK